MRIMILGTDWWSDCDDAVALRLLLRASRRQETDLRGICINACAACSAASLEGFLRAEGAAGIPIGLDAAATDFAGDISYQHRLAALYPDLPENAQAEDGVRLYRRLLAEAEAPVEIVEIGFLQVVAGLLESEGDDLSPLNGVELVREKVSRFWVMAGRWDTDGASEHNFCNNPRSRRGGAVFCRLCPVPVTFLGWEVGHDVITGKNLAREDVLHQALADHGSGEGRPSWDPMLVMLALTGSAEAAGYTAVRGTASVDEDTGRNHFLPDPHGLHSYVVRQQPAAFYEAQIEAKIT